MKSKLHYNGVSSEDLGLVVQTPPTYSYPERDLESTHVPGRNGDLYVDNKCYKNVTRTYSLAKGFVNGSKYTENAEQVLEWLTSGHGKYCKLEDSYDPSVYRWAIYNEAGSFVNVHGGALTITANFICKPQRFLKQGDEPIVFNDNIAEVINPSHYESLPIIKIDGIDSDNMRTILMTIYDENHNPLSIVTLNEINSITIDSEQQTCFNDDGNKNQNVGLNGKDFPKFGNGLNRIEIAKYEKDSTLISKYDSKIEQYLADNDGIYKSEYKPYDALVDSRQKTITVPSYSNLIAKGQEIYTAESYQSYIISACDKAGATSSATPQRGSYTFESFNTMLDQLKQSTPVFTGSVDMSIMPSWVKSVNTVGDKFEVVVNNDGYYMSSSEKQITFRAKDTPIVTGKVTANNYLYFYPAEYDKNTNELIGLGISFKNNVSWNPVTNDWDITQNDVFPNWLDFKIIYNNENTKEVPSKLQFTTNAAKPGYFWKAKSWAFGKDSWYNYTAETLLDEMSWSTMKKGFTPSGGLSTSTTKTYTYRYMSQFIQYNDVDKLKVRFDIQSSNMDQINVLAKYNGYYAYSVAGSERSEWKYKNTESDKTILSPKGTESFEIYYIPEPPTYEKTEGWPTWLETVPADPNSKELLSGAALLNAKQITFKVKETAYYRYSYYDTVEGEKVQKYTKWQNQNETTPSESRPLTAGSVIDTTDVTITVDDIPIVCQIFEFPTTYSWDRCYTSIKEQTSTQTPPNWLGVKYFRDDTIEITSLEGIDDLSTVTVRYYVLDEAWYKYDNNTTWIKKLPNETDAYLTTNFKDDVTFYHMKSLPSANDPAETKNLLLVEHSEDSVGNPTNVTLTCLVPGYYRINYNSNWTEFKANELMYTGVVGETITVNYLKPSDESLEGITITVTPKWWKL